MVKSGKSKPLRIAYIVDAWFPFVGGGQIHLKNLAAELEKNHNIKYSIYYPAKLNAIYRFFWTFIFPLKFYFLNQSQSFDLIHSHGFLSGIAGKFCSVATGTPIIHTVHGSHRLDSGIKDWKYYLEKLILTQTYYQAQITVAKSFKKYANVNKKIEYITNGVNFNEFNLQKPPRRKPEQILFVGRDHPDKGIDLLKKAFDQVRIEYPKSRLKLVTNQSDRSELIKSYLESGIFVLPSKAEGQPIVILEAFAASLPVIATDVGDNQNTITDGRTGILVPKNDQQRLFQAMVKLLSDRAFAKKMGANARKLAKEKYTWEIVAKKTYTLYTTILKQNSQI